MCPPNENLNAHKKKKVEIFDTQIKQEDYELANQMIGGLEVEEKQNAEEKPNKNGNKIAQLKRSERLRSSSDLQRMAIKKNTEDVAKILLNNLSDKEDESLINKFSDIVKQISIWSNIDYTAGTKTQGMETETRFLIDIRKKLQELTDDISNNNYEEDVKNSFISAVNELKLHFSITSDGLLEVKNEDLKAGENYIREAADNEQADETNGIKKSPVAQLKIKNIFGTRYKKISTEMDCTQMPLFSHEPSVNDIVQGRLGDCYLLAALSSIVSQSPFAIKECMHDNGKTVTVRFFKKNQAGNVEPIYVEVNKRIPRYKNDDVYAQSTLWVQMIERAYVLSGLRKNDSNINEKEKTKYMDIAGGKPGDFMQTLLGTQRDDEFIGNDKHAMVMKNIQEVEDGALINKMIFGKETTYGYRKVLDQENANRIMNKEVNDANEILNVAAAIGFASDFIEGFVKKQHISIDQIYNRLDDLLDDNFTQKYSKYGDIIHSYNTTKNIYKTLEEMQIQSGQQENFYKKYMVNVIRFMKDRIEQLKKTEHNYLQTNYNLYKQIKNALDAGRYVSTGTIKQPKSKNKGLNGEGMQDGIIYTHAYSIIGTKEENDKVYIKLRNPWSSNIMEYRQKDDKIKRGASKGYIGNEDANQGIFLIELKDFIKNFQGVWIK